MDEDGVELFGFRLKKRRGGRIYFGCSHTFVVHALALKLSSLLPSFHCEHLRSFNIFFMITVHLAKVHDFNGAVLMQAVSALRWGNKQVSDRVGEKVSRRKLLLSELQREKVMW